MTPPLRQVEDALAAAQLLHHPDLRSLSASTGAAGILRQMPMSCGAQFDLVPVGQIMQAIRLNARIVQNRGQLLLELLKHGGPHFVALL